MDTGYVTLARAQEIAAREEFERNHPDDLEDLEVGRAVWLFRNAMMRPCKVVAVHCDDVVKYYTVSGEYGWERNT